MNYGFEEKPSRFSVIVSAVFGVLAGIVGGVFTFLLATAFFGLIGDALPALGGVPAFALYTAFICVPALAFVSVIRGERASFGARIMGIAGLATLLLLFVGELTGTIRLYPRGFHFYITPGEFPRP